MQWVKASERSPSKGDLYHVIISDVLEVQSEPFRDTCNYYDGWQISDGYIVIKWLDESIPYPLLKSVNDLLGLTGCASLEEIGIKYESMRKKVEEVSTVKVSEPPY